MKTKEIVQKLMEYKDLKTAPFAEFIEVSPQNIYDIMAERTLNFSPRLRAKIEKKMPEVEPVWLATGEGPMLKKQYSLETHSHFSNTENSSVYLSLLERLGKTQEQIDRLLTIIEKLTGRNE